MDEGMEWIRKQQGLGPLIKRDSPKTRIDSY